MNIKYLLLMVIALILSSCASKKGLKDMDNVMRLDSKWQILELSGNIIKQQVNDKTPYLILDNKDNYYSVITGCNTLNGAFTLNNNRIEFSNGISTMMYCNDMSVEDGFKSILTKIKEYRMDAEYLYLLDGNIVLAKLKRFEDQDLVDTSWQLDLLGDSLTDFKKLFGDKKASLIFLEGHKVSGNAGCNNFNATVKIAADSISFGPMMTTKMMCPNIEGEQLFLATLAKVNGFRIQGNTLSLLEGDITVMRFSKSNM